MKKLVLLVALILTSIVGYSQVRITGDQADVYKSNEYVQSVEVNVSIYLDEDVVELSIGGEVSKFEVLDIHLSEDETEVHFVTQADGEEVVEELIYNTSKNMVILVNYPTTTYVVFPNVTVTKVNNQWRAM